MYLEGVRFKQEHSVTLNAHLTLDFNDGSIGVEISIAEELIEVATDDTLENVEILGT